MGLLSSFKVMKVQDFDHEIITFSTSRVCRVLGAMFIFAGLAIILQLLLGHLFFTLFAFCIFCLLVSGAFILAGLVLITYRRSVKIDKGQQRIELSESSMLGVRNTAFHFEDLLSVELTRDSECLLSKTASLWLVKAYVRHCDGISVERVFATICPTDAKFAAETISFAARKELVISCMPEERLVFSRI